MDQEVQAQRALKNREHEQWLALPATQHLLTRLNALTKAQNPYIQSADDLASFNANALLRAGYQTAIDLVTTPPFITVEPPSEI